MAKPTASWSDLAVRFGCEANGDFNFFAFLKEVFPGAALQEVDLAFRLLKPGENLQCDWEDPLLLPRSPTIQERATFHTTHLSFLKDIRVGGPLAMNPGAGSKTPALYTSPLLDTSMRYNNYHGPPVRAPVGNVFKTLAPVFIIDGERAGNFRRRCKNHQDWYHPGSFKVLGIRFECISGDSRTEEELKAEYCEGSQHKGRRAREFERRLRIIKERGYLVVSSFRVRKAKLPVCIRGSANAFLKKAKGKLRRVRQATRTKELKSEGQPSSSGVQQGSVKRNEM